MSRPTDEIQYQPQLAWYSHAWRLGVAAVLSVGVAALLAFGSNRPPWWIFVEIVVGLASLIIVQFRRRRPLLVAMILIVASAVFGAAAGPACLALVSLATRRQWLPTLLAGLVMVVVPSSIDPGLERLFGGDPEPFDLGLTFGAFGLTAALVGAAVGWGAYIGSRRALLWTLRERAERAEAEHELRAGRARESERSRIAREMHDVLAHRITHVSMQSGALAYRDGLSAERLRDGCRDIQASANAALRDLREILGVLRDTSDTAVTAPQPTGHDLTELISGAREVQPIQFEETLEAADSLSESTGRTVYRILQEALTNAAKHAPASTVTVTLTGGPETGVDLTVRNRTGFHPPADLPSSGLGLIGLRERADLAGGRLTTDARDDSFTVRVWLPWTPRPEESS